MADSSNPLGLMGIDHLEFTCDQLGGETEKLFHLMGFEKTHLNPKSPKEILSQGQIRFLINADTDANAHSRKYLNNHGEGVSTICFRVQNAEAALEEASKRGAKIIGDMETVETEQGLVRRGYLQGVGDIYNELYERPDKYSRDGFEKLSTPSTGHSLKTRVARIDHLTNNVPKGEMKHWVDFYQRIYGFKVTRYFDIKGQKTGLLSEVVQLENGRVIIPINEPDIDDGKGQIQEFLDLHRGAGVQHIALTTPDIVSTISEMRSRNMEFLKVPHTYYEDIPKRNLGVTEDLGILEDNQILVDGDAEGYLLQIFSNTYIGPLFFEYIQRKNHNGFGEGNFQALFDAIERDQEERGYI